MKCKKCGKTFPDYGKICPYCGTKPANGRKTTGLMIGVIVVLTAVLAAVLVIAIKPGTKKGGTSQKDEVYFRELDPADVVMDLGCIGYVDNELLITAELGTKRSTIVDIAEKYGAEIVGEIPECCDYQLMFSEKLPKERLEAIAAEVNEMPGIMYADLNRVTYSSGFSAPDLPKEGSDWPHDDLARWGFNAVKTKGAWNLLYDNKDIVNPIKVGIVDTGFYLSNPDLVFAEEPFRNVGHDHGTGCAGIFAANGTNTFGISGIYPYGEGNLYGASEIGTKSGINQIIKYRDSVSDKLCFQYVIKSGAKVINYSFGDWYSAGAIELYDDMNVKGDFEAQSRSLASTLINLKNSGHDFVIVAASGNLSCQKYLRLTENDDGTFSVDSDNGKIYGIVDRNINLNDDDKKYYFKHEEGCTQCENDSFQGHQIKKVKDSDMRRMIAMPSKYSSSINCIGFDIAPDDQKDEYSKLRSRIINVGAVIFSYDEEYYEEQSANNRPEFDCFRDIDYSPSALSAVNFSNVGEIYAPGVQIRNTTENGYGYSDGTSEAAPIVAGIAAMIWSANNDLRGDQVRAILLNNKVATSEENVYIPDAEACVRQALRSNPEYYYPGSDDTSKYEWTLSPSIEAEDIIVYNIEETGYDHSIFNDLAYIKQNGKYGIIDYSGEFLAKCTTEGYLISAPYLGQLSAGGLVLGSGNGDFVRYDQSGGIGLEDVNRYYSEDDKATYICRGIGDNGNFYRVDSENELNTVRLAKFVPTNNSDYQLIEDSKGTDWGIARGNTLIADCEYEAAIVPLNFKYSPNLKSGSISAIRENGKWCYIDSNGNKITGFDFNGIEGAKPAQIGFDFEQESANTLKSFSPFLPTEGLIAVKTDEGAGYIDTSGNTVIAPGTFAEARPVHNGLAWVKHKSSGLWGVIRIYADNSSGSGPEAPTTVPPEIPTEQQTTVPESANSYIGLWHGKAYYGDGRNVTNEVMKDVREYYEEDITFAEFIEIEIRENGTATMYQRRRQKRVDCNWRADGNLVILIAPDDQSVIYTLESQNSTTLKLTWDDEDKYILLEKS